MILTTLFALFALVMLGRHLPAASDALRRRRGPEESGKSGIVSLITVLLALGILTTAALQAFWVARGR